MGKLRHTVWPQITQSWSSELPVHGSANQFARIRMVEGAKSATRNLAKPSEPWSGRTCSEVPLLSQMATAGLQVPKTKTIAALTICCGA